MHRLMSDVCSVPEQLSELLDVCPRCVAVSEGDRQLSYEELDFGADRFARHLVQLGVVSGGTVAICMERSFDWIIAALGIMRAGAAYVPLDPAWPDARLRFAVDDSGATVLVARPALLGRLRVRARGIDPFRDAAAICAAPPMEPRPIDPKSLAYVIYTSGSTGTPKGVEITHSNLAHLVRWHRDAFGVTRQDRASHLMGLGFDAAVMEIWPHLCAGATLCLADEEVRASPDLMLEWMIRERVTIGLIPAVAGERLITMAWPEKTALRVLIIGGDVLHYGPARQLPFDVINNYGPTECTVAATWSVLKPGAAGTPPIGRPITGTSVYLLDERGEPVADGEPGEIYIGGDGVGRGYRNLPGLTERSFLPDPFAGAGARMYRTGDRGVRRPDGEIEFRGRLDRQTKIRGQRVELDEIGSALRQHPSIDFATVMTDSSGGGENRLVGYVLPRERVYLPTANELQMHLLQRLPGYMVPAVFVQLEALPLSSNGKLDLSMLPRPTAANLLGRVAAKATLSPIAEKLLTIVRELLENDAVTVEDNFFMVGGHSLLGTQLLMRLRNTVGVDMTLRQLFEAPSVELLALSVENVLRQSRLAEIWRDVLGQKRVGLDDDFFSLGGYPALVATLRQRIATELGQEIPTVELIQNPTVRKQAELMQRHFKGASALPPGVLALRSSSARHKIFWLQHLSADLARQFGDDHSFFSVALTAEDVLSLGDAVTLKSISTCLLNKILATQAEGPYTIGGLCSGGILAYEIASQLRSAGREVSLVVLLDSPNPSSLDSCDSPARMVRYLRYAMRRAGRLGPRLSFLYLGERLFKHLPRSIRPKNHRIEMSIAREMIETAARGYQPENYEGEVLLLLASERPPHLNFLSGWQAVVPRSLHARYVDGHRKDLMKSPYVKGVADAIIYHLNAAGEKSS